MELAALSGRQAVSLLSGLFIYFATTSLVTPRKKWWTRFLLYAACYALNMMIIFIGDLANLPPTLIAYLTAVWICCEGSKIKKITIALMIASTVFAFNALIDNYFWIPVNDCHLWLRVVFSCVFCTGIQYFAPDKDYELSSSMWRLLLLLTATPIGIVLSVILLSPESYKFPELQKVYFTLLVIALASFFGLLWTVTVLAKQRMLEQQGMFAEINHKYYETMEQQHFAIRRLKHDLANHLQTLAMLPVEQHDRYIQNLLEHSLVTQTLDYCGDNTVNAVLTVKENIMRQNCINFERKLEISSELPLEKADICALFANALDNAIESCNRLTDRKKTIFLESRAQKGLFVLSIKNPCEAALKTGKQKPDNGFFPRTTKKDAENHGYGLQSIEEIVKRYQGNLEITAENGEFELFLYIPINQPD